MTSETREDRSSATTLSVFDAVCIVVGVVIGVGIFKTPSVVAANVSTEWGFVLLWLGGALISLIGGLCYAEIAASHPNIGGEYHFLTRAYGSSVGFIFAWARLSIIQTGAIAAVAFVLGDYASQLHPIASDAAGSSALYAAIAIIALTLFNIAGLRQTKLLQNSLTALAVAAIVTIVVASFTVADAGGRAVAATESEPSADSAIGFAMIFVLLTFGGWNEAAYLSAEVRDARRNMSRVLMAGIGVITAIYLLVNLAYLNSLGLEGMRGSEVVAADLVRSTMGAGGAAIISLVIVVATLTTLNATIFTGARGIYALGRDFTVFKKLGRWNARSLAPVNALLVQGTIALILIGLGSVTRKGFSTMVEYTAPAFWLFFLLSALSLFVFRMRHPKAERPYEVPLYPLTPALFCLVCAYMLYASVAHTGPGALFGVGVMALGSPLLYFSRKKESAPR